MNDFNYSQPFVTVVGIAEDNGEFLMVKEARGPEKGRWNFPAGKWDINEQITDAVAREYEEETGYSFIPNAVIGAYTLFKVNPDRTLLRMVFLGSVSGEAITSSEEVSEVKWFSADEILDMDENTIRSADNKTILKDYLNGKKFPLDMISHSSQHKTVAK